MPLLPPHLRPCPSQVSEQQQTRAEPEPSLHSERRQLWLLLRAGAEAQQKLLSRKAKFSGPSASRRTTLEQQMGVNHRTAQFC